MSSVPRTRACRFSAATPDSSTDASYASTIGAIGTTE